MRRVFVTGATGFIGQHLITRLVKDGYAVRMLMRSSATRPNWPQGPEVVIGDVQDAAAMQAATAGCDTVFHLAARVHELSELQQQEDLYHAVNVEGTRNVLAGAIAAQVERLVLFSSVAAMGGGTAACLDEAFAPTPVTAYGRSKLAAERLVLEGSKQGNVHAVCLRLPLVYGPGDRGNFSRMLAAIDRGIFPPLPELGNRRSIVHVTNVVEAALLAATRPVANGQCYIVADARAYSTRELYAMICDALGKRVPRWYVPTGVLKMLAPLGDAIGYVRGRRWLFDSDTLEVLLRSTWYSAEKISRELGYCPSVTLQEALPELIAWFRTAQRDRAG